MVGQTVNCDIAVVGGGIVGLSIAALAAQMGYRVRVVRLSDDMKPCADTLRNQGWLQSGLMYLDWFDDRTRGRVLARQMYMAGRQMLRDLQLSLPMESDHGIMRLKDEDQAKRLEQDAEYLQLPGVARMSSGVAEELLGELYEDGIYYSIPDAPFPEDVVLTTLREFALGNEADLIQSDTPARLVADTKSESGVRVDCTVGDQDYGIFSKITVLAAGAGNWKLLDDLGVEPAMRLRQTPLLVLHETLYADVPIFADRVRKFSFVRHPPDHEVMPAGALVIGTRVHSEVAFRQPQLREIAADDRKKFEEGLPEVLKAKVSAGRFTAGYEVIPDDTVGLKDVEPWIAWVEDYRGLLKASPGRATMGMFVARQVLAKITSRIGTPSTVRTPFSRIGVLWDSGIYMHYHPSYSFNDSR
jgi:glycine/D-amino acid oxidase-like deaminating enzyme